MTTKRSIENDVEQLKEDTSDDRPPLILDMASVDHEGQWPSWDDSPHPELTIQPHPEKKPKSLKIAVPNLIAEKYLKRRWLTIVACESADRYGVEDNDDVVSACELWDALSDEDLEREQEIREKKGEQLPAILEDL